MGPGTHVPRRGKGTHRGLKRVGEVVRARANAGPEGRGRLLGLVQGQARYRDQQRGISRGWL